jgi:hypothetical protein
VQANADLLCDATVENPRGDCNPREAVEETREEFKQLLTCKYNGLCTVPPGGH